MPNVWRMPLVRTSRRRRKSPCNCVLGNSWSVIQDAGSPIDAADAAAGAQGWLAQLLGRGFADGLHASFEGREGNRCEIVKIAGQVVQVTAGGVGAGRHGDQVRGGSRRGTMKPRSPASTCDPVSRMTPEDAFGGGDLFYRTYGFTAPVADEVIYHPEKCAALVRAGLHLGTVATLADGRIVGHIAVSS